MYRVGDYTGIKITLSEGQIVEVSTGKRVSLDSFMLGKVLQLLKRLQDAQVKPNDLFMREFITHGGKVVVRG